MLKRFGLIQCAASTSAPRHCVNLFVGEQLIIRGSATDYTEKNVTQSRNNTFPPTEPFAFISVG